MFREQLLVQGILNKFDCDVDVITPQHYDSDKRLLFIANWNEEHLKHLEEALEHDFYQEKGIDIHWNDEWTTCSGCNKGIKTTPDHYGWLPNYIMTKYDVLCRDCVLDELQDLLFEVYANNSETALPDWMLHAAEDKGLLFEIQSDFESGMHPGQTDDPQKILAKYIEENPENKYIFAITSKGQFDVNFGIYKLIEEEVE